MAVNCKVVYSIPHNEIRDNKDLLIALLAEIGDQKRSRMNSEGLVTAAAVTSFGAVTWGVAALSPQSASVWYHPAIVAALGVFLMTIAIVWKLHSDRSAFAKIKAEEANLACILGRLHSVDKMLPADMRRDTLESGSWRGISMVAAASFAAIMFCVSIYYARKCEICPPHNISTMAPVDGMKN